MCALLKPICVDHVRCMNPQNDLTMCHVVSAAAWDDERHDRHGLHAVPRLQRHELHPACCPAPASPTARRAWAGWWLRAQMAR
jgi:hypothetical protein